jgi:phosphoglycolate phosphatase-like HAD superfamily hydrolase
VARLRGHEVKPDHVWVIGDTANDLACARAGGAHCLLVATGRFTRAELSGLGADAVVEDLTDTDAVVDLLTAG